MTTYIEGNRSIFLGAQAFLIEDDREMASSWASKHIVPNPAYKWVLGRFVEADRANNNRQLFSLDGLQMARPTIAHAPMNMNHSARRVVGAYVATDLIYPTDTASMDNICARCGEEIAKDLEACPCYEAAEGVDVTVTCPACGHAMEVPNSDKDPMGHAAGSPSMEAPKDEDDPMATHSLKCDQCGSPIAAPSSASREAAAASDAGLNPYIEALGVFWRHYFPDEYHDVQAAHAEGKLYYSMECIPQQIQCAGDGGCGQTFEYAGTQSPSYCDHLNERSSDKFLINPHFTAGALLVPPVRPGWSNADVHSLVAKHMELANGIYENVKSEMPHLNPQDWEQVMSELLTLATR